jgi:uncharacterized repeat protein (TIGR01451 family)
MKRTLLGVAALTGVVGLGSAGVFYAHDRFASNSPAPSELEQAEVPPPRDLTPQPIPLAQHQEQENVRERAPNPFHRPVGPQRVVASQDRNGNYKNQADADGDAPADEIPRADTAAREDEMPANRSADPLGLRRQPGSRFAERPVAAEMSVPEGADESEPAADAEPADDEPRRLPTPAAPAVDRYGRPMARREAPDEVTEDIPQADPQPPANPPYEPAPIITGQPPDTSASDESIAPAEGTGRPGDPQLSGSQAPTLTIEKTAPPEIQIGKLAKFVIKVRNAGSVVAHDVEIHDTVPQGTQLIDTVPPATRGAQGTLVWALGSLKPGEERTAELQLMPTAEGEIGSVATVHFRAQASVRTVATKPMLNVEVSAPAQAMKGQEVKLKIKLSNPGSGSATGVVLSENVPTGLSHASGNELELDVGTLKPGETREMELAVLAAAAGTVTNIVTARGEGNLQAEARADIEVVAPQLQVSMTGPKRRYLERNATHTISVANPGTATAKDIELVVVLPAQLKFIEANNGGQFDAATHSVYWGLEELPPQEIGTVTLTTLPIQPGEAKLVIKSTTKAGLKDERDEVVTIEGLAAINFQVSDVNGPIEVGGQTTYEIRVTNQGSKAAGNVRVVALMPREMKVISAEGPVRYKIEAQRVVFEPIKQLAPKADTTLTVKAQALAAGDLRVQVQITTDEIREPITKEESTRVFGNE